MREVILASHGRFAEGIEDSVTMIIGKQENLKTFGMRPGESAVDFAEVIKKEILEKPDAEFVILTDLYGASVCTAMWNRFTPHIRVLKSLSPLPMKA